MEEITNEDREEHIKYLERMGYLDPNCKTCLEIFYPFYRSIYNGLDKISIFAPSHKPSSRCQSGKRPHCTCDVCF